MPLAAARALEAWLALGLLENRHVGLDGAAIDPRDRIRLAEVFVDVAIGTDLPHWDETISEARLAPGALAALLTDRGSQNHRQKTVPAPDRPRTIERVVVVGGPGQGKSTLVQQLVQVHRAAWIEARRDALDEADRDTLDRVLARCGPDTWARPPVPRLPFLVALGALSSWRAGSPGGARLVDYLTAQVAQGGGVISAESLTALLRATP